MKKSFKVLKTSHENKIVEDQMKRLGKKDLEIIDNETNMDEHTVDKFDPFRVN